jgi:hypothetical protein
MFVTLATLIVAGPVASRLIQVNVSARGKQ